MFSETFNPINDWKKLIMTIYIITWS